MCLYCYFCINFAFCSNVLVTTLNRLFEAWGQTKYQHTNSFKDPTKDRFTNLATKFLENKHVWVDARRHQNRKDHFSPNLGHKIFFWRFQFYYMLDIVPSCNLVPGVVACSCNPATLGGNSPSIGGWIVWPPVCNPALEEECD